MLPYLPPDLVEEILARVPATSLRHLRSTCKRWNALFNDQIFTEKHFREAPKQYRALVFKNCKFCSVRFDLNVPPPYLEFKTAFGLKGPPSDSEQVNIYKVFHCDGLLLCNTVENRLVVWNPCLGETLCVKPGTHYERSSNNFCLGYENKGSCRSYKILRCSFDYRDLFRYEVYEFSSDSWRNLDNVALDFKIVIRMSVSLKGNTYISSLDSSLISFDYTTERFKRHCFPLANCYCTALSVVRDEQLSL